MTKKVRHWRGKSRTTSSVIKSVNKDNFASAICPTNIEDQKQKFLTLGKTPEFTHRGTEDELEEIYSKPRSEIRFDLLGEAIYILKIVKEKYGDAEKYYSEMYGERIGKEEATDIIVDYLKENHLDGQMSIIWCIDLPCSGRMMWQGPHVKYRRPEARKYSMWIKDSKDNNFIRDKGIRCLADHEIGTHFFRSHNDGLQPWFADRQRFGIRGVSGLELLRTEEGLAAINTVLNANVRYLFGPALLYYVACKATEMTFKELFDHLITYVENPEWRWRHCVRVKRGLLNPNDIGGYGKDQCYFEGAVEILRNIDNIDFKVLMCGKICYDEISRVKKTARLDCIQMPAFMRNQEKYKKSLKQIAHMNGLHMEHAKYKAPMAYLRRLKKGRRIGVVGTAGTKQVRKKGKKQGKGKGNGLSVFEHSFDQSTTGLGVYDSDTFNSNEDKLFIKKLSKDGSISIGDDLFETMTKQMEKADKVNVTNDQNCYSRYDILGDKLQMEQSVKELVENHEIVLKVPKSIVDWDTVCMQSPYKYLGRAQSVSSLHSNSLNSCYKNTCTERSFNSLPMMDSGSNKSMSTNTLKGSTLEGQLKGSKLKESSSFQETKNKSVLHASSSNAMVQNFAESTNIICTCSNDELQNGVSIHNYEVYAISLSNQAHRCNKIMSTSPTFDGFIYQHNETLTEDIKIKTGLQPFGFLTSQQPINQSSSTNHVKLLSRRAQ